MIYAGPSTNSRKVAEYGGNTLGYGSRSVLGTGWPKDLVKVQYSHVHHSFPSKFPLETMPSPFFPPSYAFQAFKCTVIHDEIPAQGAVVSLGENLKLCVLCDASLGVCFVSSWSS